MQEQEIIALLIAKNPQGLQELLVHYGPLMQYILRPIVPNPQDREECLSEAVFRIAEKIALFDSSRGSWTGWITSITRNTALNFLRHHRNHTDTEELTPDIPSPESSPEELVLQKERQKELENALNQLNSPDRLLFYRKYYYLQSTAQIAAELGMTERAVEGRLYRIRKRLQILLGGTYHA